MNVRLRRGLLYSAAGVSVVVGVVVLGFVDPGDSVWYPKCLFHVFTGLSCPGCGSQRALHALLGGDIAGAWRHNPLVVAFTPFLLYSCLRWACSKALSIEFPRVFLRASMINALLGCILLFGLLRNF